MTCKTFAYYLLCSEIKRNFTSRLPALKCSHLHACGTLPPTPKIRYIVGISQLRKWSEVILLPAIVTGFRRSHGAYHITSSLYEQYLYATICILLSTHALAIIRRAPNTSLNKIQNADPCKRHALEPIQRKDFDKIPPERRYKVCARGMPAHLLSMWRLLSKRRGDVVAMW